MTRVEQVVAEGSDTRDAISGLVGDEKEAVLLFEKGMEKEASGSMADAVEYYRKAFKTNERVDYLYRTIKVPSQINALKEKKGKNAIVRVDEEVVEKIDADKLVQSYADEELMPEPLGEGLLEHIHNLELGIADMDLEHGNSRHKEISPLILFPKDILMRVIEQVVVSNPESWFSFAITCKRNAYLALGTTNCWRKLCYLIYPKQIYQENLSYLSAIQTPGHLSKDIRLPISLDPKDYLFQFNYSWKKMLQEKPFVKFNGCYISVVNYYSEGGKGEFSSSLSNPVRTITYFRYLRFYPDGKCVKVLSSLEPHIVIPRLLRHNSMTSVVPVGAEISHKSPSTPHLVYEGKWCIYENGKLHIEITRGSVPYYNFHYHFQIESLRGISRHNKLSWITYYALRKTIDQGDETEREPTIFPLKNEKPFKFLRVRSYTLDN